MPYTHGHAVVNVWILGQWSLPRNDHRLWIPIILGGMLPDLPLLVFMIVEIPNRGASAAFDKTYFEQPWQDVFGYFHSIPLSFFATIALVCVAVQVYANATQQSLRDVATAIWMAATKLSQSKTNEDNGRSINGDSDDNHEQSDVEGHHPPSDSIDVPPSSSALLFSTQAAWLAAASMLLHALADLGLHTSDAHSQFLPFTRAKLRSKVSYYEVKEYAWIWMPIEATFVFFACRFITRNLLKRWCRILVYLVLASYCLLLTVTIVSAIQLVV